MRSLLVIDDNPSVIEALTTLFALHDMRALGATNPRRGLEILRTQRVDLVIADMNFSTDTTAGDEGEALFHALRAQQPDLPVILLTGWTHLDAAVRLVKAGAADYLSKPWDDAHLLATVENLLELAEANHVLAERRAARSARRAKLDAECDLAGLVFASEAMLRLLEMACQVARAAVPVLITGPNGAGKERIAAIVHANSAVRAGPFVVVNCGALPENLLEAELFGAEAGAYTGATRARAAASSRPMLARCFWTRSATCRWPGRPSCCACWRAASSS
ncbi:two component, sigma54 specific, transcriptional regulator, Fis family, partial [mine drainage metagenome]